MQYDWQTEVCVILYGALKHECAHADKETNHKNLSKYLSLSFPDHNYFSNIMLFKDFKPMVIVRSKNSIVNPKAVKKSFKVAFYWRKFEFKVPATYI